MNTPTPGQYAQAHSLTVYEVFLEAWKSFVGKDPSAEANKRILDDVAAYNIHGTTPHYASQFIEGKRIHEVASKIF